MMGVTSIAAVPGDGLLGFTEPNRWKDKFDLLRSVVFPKSGGLNIRSKV